jgi:hypothetical protein
MTPHASLRYHRHVKMLHQDYETISMLEQQATGSRVVLF